MCGSPAGSLAVCTTWAGGRAWFLICRTGWRPALLSLEPEGCVCPWDAEYVRRTISISADQRVSSMVQPLFKGRCRAGGRSSRQGRASAAHLLPFAPGPSPLLPSRLLWAHCTPFTSLPSGPGICVPGSRPSLGQQLDCDRGDPTGGGRGGDCQQAWGHGARRSQPSRGGASWVSSLMSTMVWGREGKTLLGLSQGTRG